jgi:hypothetical protein
VLGGRVVGLDPGGWAGPQRPAHPSYLTVRQLRVRVKTEE